MVASPPLVDVVRVQEVTKKHRLTEVLVTFSGLVNATEADQTATYRLATPGKRGSYTAKNAGILKLRSAVYTGATNTVALTLAKPLTITKPVQLIVYGTGPSALSDSFGRDIDGGHTGVAGSNTIAILSKGGATIDAITLAPDSDGGPAARLAAVDAAVESENLAAFRR